MQSQSASRPLEVGLLAWDYPPTGTGLATAAREIAESLAGRGVRVRAFVLDRTDDAAAGGVEIVGAGRWLTEELRALRSQPGPGHLAAPVAFARAVRAAHAERALDVIEATNWYAPGACVLALGLPLVTRCSTPVTSTAKLRGAGDVFDTGAAAALERYQARASAGLASNTAHHALKMASLYGVSAPEEEPTPHAVIGLSLPPGTPEALSAPPPGPPWRLLFVGRPSHRKGFDAIADAARALGPSFELRLVGVDAGEALPPSAVPLGRVSDEALRAEMARAHAVLAPSRYESFGLVYQEAIAAGRPVVACADDPAARAFVATAGTGVLAPECTGEAVAAAAHALVTVPARYHAARAACAVARERFSRARLGSETEALYRAAIYGAKGVSNARSSRRRAVSVAPSDIAP